MQTKNDEKKITENDAKKTKRLTEIKVYIFLHKFTSSTYFISSNWFDKNTQSKF